MLTPEFFLTCLNTIVIFPAIYLVGSLVAPLFKHTDIKMKGILYFGLGLGIFAYYAVAIGHLNIFTSLAFFVFVVFVYVLRWGALKEFSAWLSELWNFLFEDRRIIYRVGLGVFLFTIVLTFLLCFVPETANDALCYQLNLPKLFVMHHSTRPLFYDLNSYMPFLMQHLYAVALLLGSPSLAKLFHWATGVLLFFAIFLAIFQITHRKLLALFCALVFWLTPACINEVTITYNDVAVSFFLFLAALILREGFLRQKVSLYFLGGVFLGLVGSTKLIAVLWAGALGLLLWGLLLRSFRVEEAGKMILPCFLGVILASCFWFIRNGVLEGNPVFPYMERLFGGRQSFGFVESYAGVGLPKTWLTYLLLPWNVTFLPDVFDRGFWIGPFYLLVLPLALVGAWKNREARFCLAFVFLSATLWFFVAQNVRFLLPVFPLYLVAVALGYHSLPCLDGLPRLGVRLASGLVISFLLLLALYHYRYPLRVVSGLWTSEQYLMKMERSYPVARWVNKNLPANANIFNAEEIRQYYFQRDMLRESWFRTRTHYEKSIAPANLLAYLRTHGFTHILRVHPMEPNPASSGGSPYEVLDMALSDPTAAKLLITIDSENIRESRNRYIVYEIGKNGAFR